MGHASGIRKGLQILASLVGLCTVALLPGGGVRDVLLWAMVAGLLFGVLPALRLGGVDAPVDRDLRGWLSDRWGADTATAVAGLAGPTAAARSNGSTPLALAVRATPSLADRGLIVALIPAYNEEDSIGEALEHLHRQEVSPDLVVVCADNCTDRTAERAEAAGAYVYETVGNTHKKAGALNQALDQVLPELGDDAAILVMDADSFLTPTFIAEARRYLAKGFGGVGGVFARASAADE